MYQLAQPQYFYFLLLIPVVLVVYFAYLLWRRRARQAFGDLQMLQKLSPERSKSKPVVKLVLYLLIIAALSMALVNPQIGTRLETVKRKGVDIVFALDVSKSMLSEDMAPNRLEKAKQIVSKTLDQLVSDRVGLIVYAGQAYPMVPITTDYGATRMFLQNTDTELLSSQGTAISDAIELASSYYNEKDQKNRLLVILSDGEDHEEGIDDAIEDARENGINIYTIGVGTEKGGPIPIKRNGYNQGYKTDENDDVVITKLNRTLLEELAREGEGKYFPGRSTRTAVEGLMSEIETMEKKEFEAKMFADYKDQFQWLLGVALVLMVLDMLILERKTQWFKKLKLFGDEEQ